MSKEKVAIDKRKVNKLLLRLNHTKYAISYPLVVCLNQAQEMEELFLKHAMAACDHLLEIQRELERATGVESSYADLSPDEMEEVLRRI